MIEAPRFAYAPLGAGELLGRLVFYCDTNGDGISERIGEVALLGCNAVERVSTSKNFFERIFFNKQ